MDLVVREARETELDRIGQPSPVADARVSVKTSYVFGHGRITRTDQFRPSRGPVDLKGIDLEFGSYSSGAATRGGTTRFAKGDVGAFTVKGLDGCAAEPFARPEDGDTPVGPLVSRIVCAKGPMRLKGPLVVRWTMTYH